MLSRQPQTLVGFIVDVVTNKEMADRLGSSEKLLSNHGVREEMRKPNSIQIVVSYH